MLKRFEQTGYAPRAPSCSKPADTQVHLDNKWAAAIPEKCRKYWYYYEPAGDIDLICKLEFDGQEFHPTSVDVRDAWRTSPSASTSSPTASTADAARCSCATRSSTWLWWASPARNRFPSAATSATRVRSSRARSKFRPRRSPSTRNCSRRCSAPSRTKRSVSLNASGTFNLFARFWRDDPNVHGMQQYRTGDARRARTAAQSLTTSSPIRSKICRAC